MPFTVPTSQTYPWDVPLSRHLAQLNSPTTGGINTWTVTPTVGVDGVALGANHVGYTGMNTVRGCIERWDGSSWDRDIYPLKVLRTNTNFYLDSVAGNDSNSGLSAGAALKTGSGLYSALVNSVCIPGITIKVFLAAGTYSLNIPKSMSDIAMYFTGASSASVTVDRLVCSNMTVALSGMTLQATLPGAAYVVVTVNNTVLCLGSDIVLGTCTSTGSSYFRGNDLSAIQVYSLYPITVKGNPYCYFMLYNGSIFQAVTYISSTVPAGYIDGTIIPSTSTMCVVNIDGTRTVGLSMIYADNSSISTASNGGRITFRGTVTGIPYYLFNASNMTSSTVIGDPTTVNTYGFPSGISAGYVSPNSNVQGTRGI